MVAPGRPRPARPSLGWTLALVAWVCLVWGNSLVPGTGSSRVSGLVVEVLGPALSALGCADPEAQTFLVRKSAHFLEHAVLAALAWKATGAWGLVGTRRVLALVALCVGVPCVDETIQLFVPGRVGSVRDVAIDVCGAAAGLWLCQAVSRARARAGGGPG